LVGGIDGRIGGRIGERIGGENWWGELVGRIGGRIDPLESRQRPESNIKE